MDESLRGYTWSNDRGEKQEGWQKPPVPPEVTKLMLVSDTHRYLHLSHQGTSDDQKQSQ